MSQFDQQVTEHRVVWRKEHVSTPEQGRQNGLQRKWIVPEVNWKDTLWPGIRDELPEYLSEHEVQKHIGCHNLKSSWVLCANLYFPFRKDKLLLATFLAHVFGADIKAVTDIELEYAEPHPNDPHTLLGERQGQRGANQTSPDVAFLVDTEGNGKGLVLVESKFTEHSFYACSGRKKEYGNPARERCLDIALVCQDKDEACYLTHWEAEGRPNRRYWEHLRISEAGRRSLHRCPAATAGYQLFRQQALAETLAHSGKYDLVYTCVAWDDRNQTLAHCLRGAGISEFATGWGQVFDGRAAFGAFTHQAWIKWVCDRDRGGHWTNWREWICERYEF